MSSYGNYLKNLFNEPAVERVQSRRIRRLLVLAQLAWIVAAVPAVTMTEHPWPLLLWLPVFVLLTGRLNMSVRGITEIPTSHLDEMQIARRNHFAHRAHQVGNLVVLGLIAAAFIDDVRLMLAVWFAAWMAYFGLPTLLAAWSWPDESPEDE